MDTGVQMKHNEATHEKMYELLMHAASQLRKKLAIDDLSYRVQLSPSTDSKKYFLHNVLNEFDKAVFSLMFACGFLADNRNAGQPQEIDKPMTSKIFQTKIDELALWRRKLVEVLADLIGFKKANVASYYHHYNLLHELNKKKKDAKDRRTFWDCTNKTAAREIKAIEDNAQQISINLDPQKCWYAEKNKAGQIQHKLSNESSRFESILSIASKHHKALLLSYRNAFGKPSELLHPERITEAKDTTIQDFEQAIRGLILLGLHVLSAIKDLLRIHNVKGSLKQVANVIKKNPFPTSLFTFRTNPSLFVRDFVISPGGPAQIIRKSKSRFGYRTFHVKFLIAQKGVSSTEEFLAEEIRLLAPYKTLKQNILKILLEANPSIKIDNRKLNKAMKNQVLESWPLLQGKI